MKTNITQPPEAVPAEIIASAIVQIGNAARAINSTRLSRKALVALIHDQSKVSKKTIDIVINNLADLEKDWLKPAPAK